jgi:hypothetical protein
MAYRAMVPRVTITVPHYGDLTSGFTPRLKMMSCTWGANVFAISGASIEGWEFSYETPKKYMNSREFGGLWVINCLGQDYVYMMDSLGSGHLQNRSFKLVDLTTQWDVLLTQMTITAATLIAAGKGATVGGLINYIAAKAAEISLVALDRQLIDTTLLDDVMEGDTTTERTTYLIANSTYLAELNRLLLWFGYTCFAEPATGKISLIAPITQFPYQSIPSVNSLMGNLADAEFSIEYGSMHSDVVVASNESNKGAVCGKSVQVESAMQHIDTTNFDVTKRYNPLFATTYRVADSELLDVAKKMLRTDRIGAQSLRIIVQGVLPVGLWYGFDWKDKNGENGHWVVTGYEISVTGSSAATTVDCIIGPATGTSYGGSGVKVTEE